VTKTRNIVFAVLALLCCKSLMAQINGCDDSPEAPTDILLLVGSLGMFYGSSVVMKLRRRNRNK